MSARYLIGDVFTRMADIPDGSIDLVMTSPPFLALRSYLPADHPDKALEIGSEPDPASFLDTLLALTAEWRRVLAPHGSICVELGDTYSGSGGAGGDYAEGGMREGQDPYNGSGWHRVGKRAEQSDQPPNYRKQGTVSSSGTPRNKDAWPLPKSLAMIPELYRVALAYGINPLSGAPSPAGRWRCRNVVRWHRPNPPVGALGDKFRPSTSDMVIACVSGKRYFDLDAVRTPTTDLPTVTRVGQSSASKGISGGDSGNPDKERMTHNPAGAPPLDTWVIPTVPYSGSHYAVYPPALVERPIKSMVPLKVCTVCGEPSRRITSEPEYVSTTGGRVVNHFGGERKGEGVNGWGVEGGNPGHVTRTTSTIGWSECECPDDGTKWRTGVVLDPFAGSGTTLMVATGHGRDAIGIDLDARNADLALDRVGPLMLTVEHPVKDGAA